MLKREEEEPCVVPFVACLTMGHPSKGEKSSTMQSVISFVTRVDFLNNANVE
jgi:hypothetical protein